MSDTAPARTDSESDLERRRTLLLRVMRVMGLLVPFAFFGSLLEPKNSKLVSVVFYGVVTLGIWFIARLARRGRVVLAAWLICSFFWLLIAFAVLFCGGMQGSNAATFTVCVMLVGGVVGGRAAIVVAIVTSIVCAVMALLEHSGHLPPQIEAYSPVDAWVAVTVTLLLTSVLLRAALESLQRAHAEAEASAKERDRALAKSIEAQKMEVVGNLSGGIAHDFNNLLMVIAGSTSLLKSEFPGALSEGRRYLEDIEAATSRATLMTRQLLSFGHGRVDDRAPLELGEIVRSMAGMLPRLLGSRIAVNVRTPEEAVVIMASRAGLEQILLNLSVNARDAMPEGGELTLELSIEGDEAVLRARDTGVGMSEATRVRAFDPFFTTKSMGTGLGLATVLTRVKQFGGTIHAESELGRGAAFVAHFPLYRGSARYQPSALSGKVAPNFRGRALLVEDDGLVRRTVGRMLESAGFEVTSVVNGLEALGVLRGSATFSIVISDLSMPRLGGRVLIEQMREQFPTVPILLISANADADPGAAALELPILQKPIDQDGLLHAIDRATTRVAVLSASYRPDRLGGS